jgi:cytoskeleton protein RodZ
MIMAERTPDYELTPGALLRRSRQRYGWSVEDVADELKLLPYVVEAIEQDDYSQMAGWTYAVGYLRGYAKLVGVNLEPAIVQHSSLLPQKEDGPGTLTYRTGGKVAIPISSSWVITVIVIIVVIGGIGATYWKRANDADRVVLESIISEERAPVPTLPQISSGTPEASEVVELAVVSDGNENSTLEQHTNVIQSPTVTPESMQLEMKDDAATQTVFEANSESSTTAEVVVRPLTLTDIDTRIIGSLPGKTSEDVGNLNISSVTVENLPQRKLGSEAAKVVGGTSLRELVFVFDQGSWADIRDARGRQLLRESVRAGATVQMEGDPPFVVFVGNARGVRYFYRGEENMAPTFGDGLFGRFQIGVAE